MVRINLLPIREILRKRELKQFAILAGAILAGTIGIMVLAYLAFSFKEAGLQKEKGAQEKKLAQLKEKNREIETLKAEITRLQKQVDTIQSLTKIRDTPAPFMAAISRCIPDEVWLTTISKSHRSFTLEGMGLDNTVVVKFVENLQELKQNFLEKSEGPAQEAKPGQKSKPGQSFFSSVKLVQIVAGPGGQAGPGSGSMSFRIVGEIR